MAEKDSDGPYTTKGFNGKAQVESNLQNSENRNLCSTFKMEFSEVSQNLGKYPQSSASLHCHEEIIWFCPFSASIGMTLHPLRRLSAVYYPVSSSVLEVSSIRGFMDIDINGSSQISIRKFMFA